MKLEITWNTTAPWNNNRLCHTDIITAIYSKDLKLS